MSQKNLSWKSKLHEVIFGVDTPAGRLFDIVLLWAILVSVLLVLLESVPSLRMEYGELLLIFEWIFTIFFTIEYVLRVVTVNDKKKYIFSFYGLIDFFSVIPTYLSFLVVGTHSFLVLRAIRLLRVFRVLKLVQFSQNAKILVKALRSSRIKIMVFMSAVLLLVTILGTIMYLVEGETHGFTSIPKSIYWAIVTLTTVGYGDITPKTVVGQILSSFVMLIGYGVIAVPTGIVSVELHNVTKELKTREKKCGKCKKGEIDIDAKFCRYCGESLI